MPRRSSACDHQPDQRPAWRLGDLAGVAITRVSSRRLPSGQTPNPTAVNKYGRLAMSHWQRTDPARYAEIPEPKETFFGQLGEHAELEIQEEEEEEEEEELGGGIRTRDLRVMRSFEGVI